MSSLALLRTASRLLQGLFSTESGKTSPLWRVDWSRPSWRCSIKCRAYGPWWAKHRSKSLCYTAAFAATAPCKGATGRTLLQVSRSLRAAAVYRQWAVAREGRVPTQRPDAPSVQKKGRFTPRPCERAVACRSSQCLGVPGSGAREPPRSLPARTVAATAAVMSRCDAFAGLRCEAAHVDTSVGQPCAAPPRERT